MKEDFLTHLWQFQKFNTKELFTTCGSPLQILSPGESNYNSGPDFFNASIAIGEQLWAGNVEVHVKSSMWYKHSHQLDANYDSVILHVVWQHDTEVYRSDNTVIPTLELKHVVIPEALINYRNLLSGDHKWIPCESDLKNIPTGIKLRWLNQLYIERLRKQSDNIKRELKKLKMNWETLLFRLLCKNFGMKVNGVSFLSIARSIDFTVIKKSRTVNNSLEAILLGQAGLLEGDSISDYFIQLQNQYAFMQHKFGLKNDSVIRPKFFRLRPANFPTIRLSQLAELYRLHKNLFSKVITSQSKEELYTIFDITASDYWDSHFNFGSSSVKKKKRLTRKFVDLVIINTIIPLQFCYGKYYNQGLLHSSRQLLVSVSKEDNSIVRNFSELGLYVSNAEESQALIRLNNHYCKMRRCMDCSIGNYLIKGEST